MKSEITEHEKDKTSKYPYLGIAPASDGIVVFFYEPQKGIVVFSNNSKFYEIGYYSDSWFESDFEYFTGKATLSN